MRTCPLLTRFTVSCLFLWCALPGVRADDPAPDLQKEALALNGVLGETSMQEKLAELRKDKDHARQLLAAALALHRQRDTAFNYSAAMILAALARDLKHVEAGDAFCRRALAMAEQMQSDRRLARAYQHWITLLIDHQKYAEAETACKQVLELKRDADALLEDDGTLAGAKLLALRRLIMVYALQGKTQQAEQTLKPFLESGADDLDVMDIHAWLLRYQDKPDAALKVYQRILAALPKGERFDSFRDEYQEIIGSLYGDLGNLDKAMEYLLPLLKKNPDDPGLNNDIGYMWADHGRNLDEAVRMIRKAVAKEPDNPSYLDSLGWVLYKQKQYAEAKQHLLKAVSFPRGNNTEILDHLGDVHHALGEKAEAVAAWKKAADAATARQRDQKRKEKIVEKIRQAQP